MRRRRSHLPPSMVRAVFATLAVDSEVKDGRVAVAPESLAKANAMLNPAPRPFMRDMFEALEAEEREKAK
jgi:hypothetical protein